MSRTSSMLASLLLMLLLSGLALGADIVTVPTANQMGAGQVDLAYYHIWLDLPEGAPTDLAFATMYVGITDRIELDAHWSRPSGGPADTLWIAQGLLLKEGQTLPNVALGVRNIEAKHVPRSYYISAAKTLNTLFPKLFPGRKFPAFPVIRGHVSLGTLDQSLLGEGRHQGLFGGIQALLNPQFGLVALWDGEDAIAGITWTRNKHWPTIKGGILGKHTWLGVNYTFNQK